ncbi:MAG TPA: MFS transporter, partial [Solirubrobacteraceae bacterium]|nr:MFS transporter [Solirubrobacteraceae bacterium]
FRVDGALGVGLVGVLSELPAALSAPLTAVIPERIGRRQALLLLAMVRSAELCVAALAYSQGAPIWVFYTLLGIDSVLSSAVFPAQQGLLRHLARSRREYDTSPPVTALAETVGGGLGPLIGGVLLATTSMGAVYAFTAAVLASTAIMFLRMPRRAPDAAGVAAPQAAAEATPPLETEEPVSLIGDFIDGLRATRGNRDALLLLTLFGVDALLEGALDVMIVVLALDVLNIGAAGVGALGLVEAIGGVIGGLLAFRLVRRRKLATAWGVRALFDAMPSVLIGVFPLLSVTVVMLIVWEAFATADEAMGLTLLRRVVPEDLLPRTLGLEDSVVTLSLAVGALSAPALIAALHVRWSMVAVGSTAFLLVLLILPGLRRIDVRHEPVLESADGGVP